jgi:hypothetical protein
MTIAGTIKYCVHNGHCDYVCWPRPNEVFPLCSVRRQGIL